MPSEMSVLLNDSIQLVCHAKGTPAPTIQWLKDGEALNQTGLKNIRCVCVCVCLFSVSVEAQHFKILKRFSNAILLV